VSFSTLSFNRTADRVCGASSGLSLPTRIVMVCASAAPMPSATAAEKIAQITAFLNASRRVTMPESAGGDGLDQAQFLGLALAFSIDSR
jgi:hypothetical protein